MSPVKAQAPTTNTTIPRERQPANFNKGEKTSPQVQHHRQKKQPVQIAVSVRLLVATVVGACSSGSGGDGS
jgi:hypothetical protein